MPYRFENILFISKRMRWAFLLSVIFIFLFIFGLTDHVTIISQNIDEGWGGKVKQKKEILFDGRII